MLGTLLESVTTLLAAVIAAVVPVIAAKAWELLQERIKASAQARLGEAAARAAGQVYSEMASAMAGSPAVVSAAEAALGQAQRSAVELAKQAAVARLTEQVHDTMAATVTKLGGTRQDVEQVLRGEVGKLLAKSPIAVAAPLAIGQAG